MSDPTALSLQQLASEFCEFNPYADRTILYNFAGWLAARGVRVLPSEPNEAKPREFGPYRRRDNGEVFTVNAQTGDVTVLSQSVGGAWQSWAEVDGSFTVRHWFPSEREALAVRDALNRVAAAPRPEEP